MGDVSDKVVAPDADMSAAEAAELGDEVTHHGKDSRTNRVSHRHDKRPTHSRRVRRPEAGMVVKAAVRWRAAGRGSRARGAAPVVVSEASGAGPGRRSADGPGGRLWGLLCRSG